MGWDVCRSARRRCGLTCALGPSASFNRGSSGPVTRSRRQVLSPNAASSSRCGGIVRWLRSRLDEATGWEIYRRLAARAGKRRQSRATAAARSRFILQPCALAMTYRIGAFLTGTDDRNRVARHLKRRPSHFGMILQKIANGGWTGGFLEARSSSRA